MSSSLSAPALPANRARAQLQAGELVRLYVTGNFASPRHVDFIGRTGAFDAIWFDLEHFDLPIPELAVLNLVARAYPLTTIARFRATDYQVVQRVLETGIGGIMCAMVGSADEARQIVQWAKFHDPAPPPGTATGVRGWNGGNIDGAYATLPPLDYLRHQNRETLVICQIETAAAVAAAPAIAAVPGVDGLFFGPGDYAALLGVPGQIRDPRVAEARRRTGAAATAARKWWGTVAVGPEMCAEVFAEGGRLLCAGGDVKVMQAGVRELAKSFPTTVPPAR